MAAKIANVLNVTVDYLIGSSDHIIMDKGLIRRMEDIEALPSDEKDKDNQLAEKNKLRSFLSFASSEGK